jgi:hypothetical protein
VSKILLKYNNYVEMESLRRHPSSPYPKTVACRMWYDHVTVSETNRQTDKHTNMHKYTPHSHVQRKAKNGVIY